MQVRRSEPPLNQLDKAPRSRLVNGQSSVVQVSLHGIGRTLGFLHKLLEA